MTKNTLVHVGLAALRYCSGGSFMEGVSPASSSSLLCASLYPGPMSHPTVGPLRRSQQCGSQGRLLVRKAPTLIRLAKPC